jgi:hypothetical protein
VVYEKGPSGPSLDYSELETKIACSKKNELKELFLLESKSGIVFRLIVSLNWNDKSMLSEKFPKNPLSPETEVFDCISSYSVVLIEHDTGLGVVVFDSYPHHPFLSTHPHHLHPIVNNLT